MSMRLLALALLATWAPAALAFPPCPREPLEISPIDGPASVPPSSTAAPWHRAAYALVGDPAIIDLIRPIERVAKSGKCRDHDTLPVPAANNDSGSLDLKPRYAPISGFGIIALPDLRGIESSVSVLYTLDFMVDNTRLATGDWFDIVELRYQWQDYASEAPSAAYRVRKRQGFRDAPVLEVIEAEAPLSAEQRPRLSPRVIATIPMANKSGSTRIALRFSHKSKGTAPVSAAPATGDEIAGMIGIEPLPILPGPSIESSLEVLEAGDNIVGSVLLPHQWASELSMGLLNYNVASPAYYPSQTGVRVQAMSFVANEF